MSWLDRLLPGSFRGAEFGVDAHRQTGGRRVHSHEYPGRDRPYTEDLGRRSRAFTVEGWIVGRDYDRARDALVRACEARGPGRLVHPWRGVRSVACERYELSERSDEGGMCRITMSFVESGRNVSPARTVDVSHALEEAMGAAARAAVEDFTAEYRVAREPSFVPEEAAALARELAREVGPAADTLASRAAALVYEPDELGSAIRAAVEGVPDEPRLETLAAGALGTVQDVPETTPNRRRQARNQRAVTEVTRAVATTALVRQIVDGSYRDRPALVARRGVALDLIDARAARASTRTYRTFQALRGVMNDGVEGLARELPRVVQATPGVVGPSLVVAYSLYGDITRADEIVGRNVLPRPGFVPSHPLEVLDE